MYTKAITLYMPIVEINQKHLMTRCFLSGLLYFKLAMARSGGTAIDTSRKAVELAEQITKDFPGDGWAIHNEIYCVTQLMGLLGDTVEARQRLEHTQKLSESTDVAGSMVAKVDHVKLLFFEARFLHNDGQYDKAEQLFRRVIILQEQIVLVPSRFSRNLRLVLSNMVFQLGCTLAALDRMEDAIVAQQRAVGILEKLVAKYAHIPSLATELKARKKELAQLIVEQAGNQQKPQASGVKTETDAQPAIAPKPEQSEKQ